MDGAWDFVVMGFAALIAGMVNAMAGGGTLITFPMLTALGVPPISASVTNTVALCPGYLGGALAQAKELRGQTRLLWLLVPTALIGGLSGAALLLNTEEKVFRAVVPFLVLGASAVTALQGPLRAWIARRSNAVRSAFLGAIALVVLIGLAGIYGGYFNAALSIIVLAVLGLALDETFTRLNAIKQVVSFTTTSAAAVFFLWSGEVLWVTALMMALAALAGGVIGGRLASYVEPAALRLCVVAVGTVVGVTYLVR